MILCIVQARAGSSRFPGKILKEICGKPMLELELERISGSKHIEKLIVATTVKEGDNEVEDLCRKIEIGCYRGSEDDVLDRFYKAAAHFGAGNGDVIIRLTGDCPLIDPKVIDNVIDLFKNTGAQYCSNVNPPTFPDGLDVEVISFEALKLAWESAGLKSEREHVTPFIRNNNGLFKQANLKYKEDLSALRLTVDEKEDFEVVSLIYEGLYYSKGKGFTLSDILEYLKNNPLVMERNSKFERNEGYIKSLENDKSR